MMTIPMTTIKSETDDVFNHETLNQSPCDGFVGSTPPPPPPPPPPVPPLLNNNNIINNCKTLLPHQEVNLVVNRTNLTEIQARSIPSIFTTSNNIWTRRVLPNLRIKQTVFDQHFGDSKSLLTNHYRRTSVSTSCLGGGGGNNNDDGPLSFVLLDATSKMLYDVPMRHLLQLVKKDYDDDASIDHVIRAIDETHMKSEWLDAVTALYKQFDKRPEDKARVIGYKGSTHGLVLIEQFFVKLVRVPAYEFKLIYLKFDEEAPTQLERMNKHIHDLLESIDLILNNEHLPGILHLLCLLYNSITGKTIPGLHFDSILSVVSTRTLKQNTTIAHLLCYLLEEQYPTLLNILDNQILLKLKDLSSIKYIPIYIDIRLLYTRYKQLINIEQELIYLPEHMKTTLNDLQNIFTKLFDNENKIKKGEKDLSTYFCSWDLSIENCFSTLGLFIEKFRLAHLQNLEQRRRNQLLNKQTPTRSLRSPYSSETNIFRDHLNVPLTPLTPRQRYKINRISRDRYTSSRDVSYEEQHEQIIQNLLPNAVPRKRGHSPTTKTVLTKRPFNVLGSCTNNKQQEEMDDVFISTTSEHKNEDVTMDCSSAESAVMLTPAAISVCEPQPSFYLTTPIQQLIDFSTEQNISNILPKKIEEYDSDTTEKENQINHSITSKQNSKESPLSSNAVEDENHSLPLIDESNVEVCTTITMPIILSDVETLDEGFESQSNISEGIEPTPQPSPSMKRSSNSIRSSNQLKTNPFSKRTPFAERLRSVSTNNIIPRNVQRCAVSRRISTENDTEQTHTIQPQSPIATHRVTFNKSKTTIRNGNSVSSFSRPLRAFHMSPITNNASSSSPKSPRRTPAAGSHNHHPVSIQKTFAGRTITATVLPTPNLNTNQKTIEQNKN